MQFTLIGLVIFITGVTMLLGRRLEALFAFMVGCTLMGGSAAVVVTALGSASISPAHLALGFLFARVLLRRHGEALAWPSIRDNMAFLVFAAYGVVGAIALPRIFKNSMDVVPMRPTGLRSLYDAFPLEPTSQNVTTAVYIVGTLLTAICAYIAVRQPRGAVVLVKTAVFVTAAHAIIGILSATLGDTFVGGILAFFRNGSYAQVEQVAGGFVRIAGIMPEASTYATFGFAWLVFCAELWLRDVMPRRTGPAAALMALVLVCSTSSTAYLSLAVYVAIVGLRLLLFPQMVPFKKVAMLLAFALALSVTAAVLMAYKPALADSMLNLLKRMTIDKAASSSGLQRSFWAKQGLAAFQTSYGLGIGAGSFRSSSFATAVLGSLGLVGVSTLLIYLVVVMRPLRTNTYLRAIDPVDGVGVASSWAALLSLVPISASGASPDPGLTFAVFAGAALALRALRPREAPDGPIGMGEAPVPSPPNFAVSVANSTL